MIDLFPFSEGNYTSMDKTKRRFSVKKELFKKSKDIHDSLLFEPLWSHLIHPTLQFLTAKEIDHIHKQQNDYQRANELLLLLHKKAPLASRKFIACLSLEVEHRGHRLLVKSIMRQLPRSEVNKINRLVKLTQQDNPASPRGNSPAIQLDGSLNLEDNKQSIHGPIVLFNQRPEKPMPPFHLVGDLDGDEFHKLDRQLWYYFSTGKYESLEKKVERIRSMPQSPSDWKIVAMWFQALIVMHRDNDYHRCIGDLLLPALQQCSETNSENQLILEGRIYQRMAQIYLVMNLKDLAVKHFEMAKRNLQFVGRGYDKANMFCREAKLLTATSTERDKTERMYNDALDCVPEDAPFALASRPSLILSKAAFHLHISFGSAPQSAQRVSPPSVSDIKKAKETLKCLPLEHIMISMRKCEHELLSTELLRLDGKHDEALEVYKVSVQHCKEVKLKNLITIAESRIGLIKDRKTKISLLDTYDNQTLVLDT